MPETILVVDNTSTNRKLTHQVLSMAGFDVRSVADAAAALDAIPECQPQLVLTELRLEGMDGIALTRRIKEDPRTRRTVVIAVTGCSAEGDRIAAMSAGCDDFIVKPIDTRALPSLIQTHLARRDREVGGVEGPPPCPAVELPSWAIDLCREFAQEGASKAAQFLQEGSPSEEIRRAAHVWAGLGGTFGYPEITELARELEKACRIGAGGPEVTVRLQRLAGLFSEIIASLHATRHRPQLPDVFVQALSGKTCTLVGFDPYDRNRLEDALHSAGAQVLSGAPGDTGDLIVAAAGSAAAAALLQEFRRPDSRPLLLVGASGIGRQVEAMLDCEAFDFVAAPWTAEEVLARAYRHFTRRVPPAVSGPGARDRKLRVVIADDDATVLALLKTTVESYGIDCVVAGEGDQALELMRATPPDAAILDVIMPNMDGLEVLATIRNDPILKNVRVLLLSALQQESDIVRALGLGADDYVTKPFSPLEVVARLKRLVRSEP